MRKNLESSSNGLHPALARAITKLYQTCPSSEKLAVNSQCKAFSEPGSRPSLSSKSKTDFHNPCRNALCWRIGSWISRPWCYACSRKDLCQLTSTNMYQPYQHPYVFCMSMILWPKRIRCFMNFAPWLAKVKPFPAISITSWESLQFCERPLQAGPIQVPS